MLDKFWFEIDNKRVYPQIYLYSDKYNPSWVKIGYTTRIDPEDRIKEQYNTRLQLEPDCYMYLYSTSAVRYNGVGFTDSQVHAILKDKNVLNRGEFYQTDLYTISKAILDIKNDITCFEGIKPVGYVPKGIKKFDCSGFKPVRRLK